VGSNPCTNACSESIQTADESKFSASSINDKESHLKSRPTDKSVLSEHKTDAVICEKLCKNESADGARDLENELKGVTACSDDKLSRTDRRQRREKRPDVQRYVPKPKQKTQCDFDGSSDVSTESLKSSGRDALSQSECASAQKCGSAESSKSDAVPQLSTTSAPNNNRTLENRDNSQLIKQSNWLQSEPTATCHSSESTKSSATSLPHSSGDLLSSGHRTAEQEDSSDPVHSGAKLKVPKPVKSQNTEPKQEASECFDRFLGLKIADCDKRGKPADSMCSEDLDWDFDGELEYNHDGLSWGDLPPPSDHESSDEEGHDYSAVPTQSAANTRKPKPRKQRTNRRKRRQQTEAKECDDPGGKLIDSSVKSSTAAAAGGCRSTKLEQMVVTNRHFADGQSAVHGDERLAKNHNSARNGHYSDKVGMESHLYLHRHQKDAADELHLGVRTELEHRSSSKDQRRVDKDSTQTGGKQQFADSVMENGREENAQQRPGSGRVGGIIRLPVGTVTTALHDAVPSVPSLASTSARGRNRRSTHSRFGHRGIWSPDAPESSAQQPPSLSGYDRAHASYPAECPPYYQRQSPASQMYYAEYPPVSGASQLPPVNGYMYGYPPVSYDGLGYVDDSYYH